MNEELICPYCAQPVDVHPDVDVAEDGHTWVEDCAVYCHPITFTSHVDREGHSTVSAQAS